MISVSNLPGMHEGQRQRYLAALGIPVWTTRHELPGAQTASPLAFVAFVEERRADVTPVPPVAEPLLVVTEAAPSRVLPAAAQAARPLVAQRVSVSPPPGGVAAADESFPRFSCRVQPLAPGWMGVIALDGVPDLSAREHRLLDNLAQALGGDGAMAGAREHFSWPLSPNPAIARDAGAAREALAAFLGRRRETAHWLVLGATLGIYVRTALPQQRVIAAPALRELLENPAAKRALWQALHG